MCDVPRSERDAALSLEGGIKKNGATLQYGDTSWKILQYGDNFPNAGIISPIHAVSVPDAVFLSGKGVKA